MRAQEFAKPGTLSSFISPPSSFQDSEGGGGGFPSSSGFIDNDLSHAWHFKSPVSGLQQISGPGTSQLGTQTIQFKQPRPSAVKQKQDSGPLTPSRLFEPPNSLTFGFRYVFGVFCHDQLFLRTSFLI